MTVSLRLNGWDNDEKVVVKEIMCESVEMGVCVKVNVKL